MCDSVVAFLLADASYDVWLGNFRGNGYSQGHRRWEYDGTRRHRSHFWDFSIHELGVNDLPAMIDYILKANPVYEKIHYVGHSLGTTAYFIMTSERPGYNDKIQLMQALSPMAFHSNSPSPLARALSELLVSASVCQSSIM